jgi:hypothetical protein
VTDKKIEKIKLDGTIIRYDGSQSESNYFKFLELHPDDYSDISFTPEQAKKIRAHLMHLSTGAAAAVPLVCGGAVKCPFSHNCPFVRIDKENKNNSSHKSVTPVGRQCLIEINLLNQWTMTYIDHYEVHEQNFTEVGFVRELAELELMLWRLNNNLAKPEHAELVQETVVGQDREGNALVRKEVNSFWEAKERIQNRKTKIVKLMVGDREGGWKRQAALKQKNLQDASVQAADIRILFEKVKQQTQHLDMKLKAVEQKVINGEIVEEDTSPPASDDILTPEDLLEE